jgi:hypothetical protein
LYLHSNIFTGEDMTKDEALRLALEALEYEAQKGNDNAYQFERESIKAALEAKDEPVAWRAWVSKFPQGTGSDWVYVTKPIMKDSVHNQPLYTTPPQRTWVGLTDEDEIDWEEGGNLKDLVKAIEAKLKQKNGNA